ncbi:MAG: hypothetical protein SFV53_01530 [Rickettsiales bacterium]|nr:hypothetical protein [Rickettsiales bacterium]
MATTIYQSFEKFRENLEITDNQSEAISNCRKNLVSIFAESHLSLHDQETRVIGSYARSTLIRPLSAGDVDLMIILHYGNNKESDNAEGTVKILDKFKRILDNKYPDTPKRRDRNCITMELANFKLDVVPAFYNEGGYYKIPDSIDKQWINTNPVKFAEEITRINKAMGGSFVPLIKMVKAWNKANGDFLNGYHIECLMYHRYNLYKEGYTYDSMLKNFFENLPNYLQNNCLDPIKFGSVDSYLGSYFDDSRKYAIKKAEKAKEISALASQKSASGYIESSIKLWKELLGGYFPTYG